MPQQREQASIRDGDAVAIMEDVPLTALAVAAVFLGRCLDLRSEMLRQQQGGPGSLTPLPDFTGSRASRVSGRQKTPPGGGRAALLFKIYHYKAAIKAFSSCLIE